MESAATMQGRRDISRMRIKFCAVMLFSAVAATQSRAQTVTDPADDYASPATSQSSAARASRSTESAFGRVGQRQSVEDLAERAGLNAIGRITNRLRSRADTRIDNRLDPDKFSPDLRRSSRPGQLARDISRTGNNPR